MTAPVAYTRDELIRLLEAGALALGATGTQAAIHLLTFTALPGRADLAHHIDINTIDDVDGFTVTGAFVRDWPSLAAHDHLFGLTGTDERMLALAASLADGVPVDLRNNAAGFGSRPAAARVLEAMAIWLGVEPYSPEP